MKTLYDKLFEICCSIAEFILRPAVRWTIRVLTGLGLVIGVFLLARALLVTRSLNLLQALPIMVIMTVLGCLGLKEG